MSRLALIVLLLLVTASCAKAVKPTIPEVVRVTVPQYVAPPGELTKPCTATRAKNRTVEAVVSAYNANVIALTDCDRRMSEIRKLGQ